MSLLSFCGGCHLFIDFAVTDEGQPHEGKGGAQVTNAHQDWNHNAPFTVGEVTLQGVRRLDEGRYQYPKGVVKPKG